VTGQGTGIVPPVLQCINMFHNNSDCTIYWNHPNDYQGIESIEVWVSKSPNANDFRLGTTVYASDSIGATHINITNLLGNDVEDIYCYLKVFGNNHTDSAQSSTMHSMKLTLTPIGNNVDQNSIAVLQWNTPDPFPATCENVYSIWRKTSYNPDFVRIARVSQNTNTFHDTIDVCEDNIQYYVSILNHAAQIDPACPFKTRPKGDTFSDGTAPKTPTLDSVSVNQATQQIELGWTQNSPDAIGCIIYHATSAGGPWPPYDTVIGTHWIDTHHQSNSLNYYRIAAIDSCFESERTTAGNMTNFAQNNMILSKASMDVCRKKIKLQWNGYEHMTNNIDKYNIYYAQDNGNMQYLASVNGNNISYECNGLPTNHQYSFFVQAVNVGGQITASSNTFVINDYIEEAADDFCYLRHVSVIDNQYIEVKTLTDGANTPFSELYIYKSINNNQNFTRIATLPYQNGVSEYKYEDYDVDVSENLYYYKVSLRNECGAESTTSNTAHNILLKGEANAAQENALRWNNYSEFNGGTVSYSIYRKVEISPYFVDIVNNLPASELNDYNDNVSDLYDMGSHFQYYVVAQEGLNEYGFADVSISNIIEVEQFPNTYIPNAFCPNSTLVENQVFKPVNSFMGTTGYVFTIYSRQGEIVFVTNDITQGWDGTEQKSGKAVPPGMYIYHLEYIRPDRQKVVRNGTVTVIY
jgi:hypothetical protein